MEQVHRWVWESVMQWDKIGKRFKWELNTAGVYYFLHLPHDVSVDFVLYRRSRSDPTKLDSEPSPQNWLSCAPTLLTARSKVASWRSTGSETSIWSSR